MFLKKSIRFFLLIFIITIYSCSEESFKFQRSNEKNTFIDKETIERGKRLKEKFPQEDFYAEKISSIVTFSKLFESNSFVGVISNVYESIDIYSLNDNQSFNDNIYFSGEINFLGVGSQFNKNKNTRFSPKITTRNIERDGIFMSDDKYAFYGVDFPVIGTLGQIRYAKQYKDLKYLTNVYFPDAYHVKEREVKIVIPDWFEFEILEKNLEGFDVKKHDTTVSIYYFRDNGNEEEKASYSESLELDNSIREKPTIKIKNQSYFHRGIFEYSEFFQVGKYDQLKPLEVVKKSLVENKVKLKYRDSKKSNYTFNNKNEDSENDQNDDSKKTDLDSSALGKTRFKIITYTINNLKPLRNEPNAAGGSYNIPHLVLLSKSYEHDGEKTRIISDTKDLYGWYKSLVDSVNDNDSIYKNFTLQLTKDCKTEEEKVKAVFYWIQDNIKYLAFADGIAGFMPESSQNVFKSRYGDCKGMANLAKNMLKILDIDARLTWIGTRHIAYDYSIPSISVDNHMITTVYLKNGKKYHIDPTEKFISLGDYAERIQGRQILIENGNDFIIDSIPVFPIERNTTEYKYRLKLDKDKLNGSASHVYTGENRIGLYNLIQSIPSDKRSIVLNRIAGASSYNFKVKDLFSSSFIDRDIPLSMTYNVEISNQVIKDKNYYVNLNFDRKYENDLIDTNRFTDIDLDGKSIENYSIELAIDQNMKIIHLPSPIRIDNEDFSIYLEYKQIDDKLMLFKKYIIKTGFIHKRNFQVWNDAIKKLDLFYNDFVIIN